MKKWQPINHKKALEVLLYIAQRENDLFRIMKYFYIADKEHLAKWGRLISTDDYRAMRHGPVPRVAYDLIKDIREDRTSEQREVLDLDEAISIKLKNIVEPLREPDLECLSKSDTECLDAVIERFKEVNWDGLEELTHDDAYNKSEGDIINLLDIVATLPNADEVMEYLRLGDES